MAQITPTDIANRALQKCGVTVLIAAGALATEQSEKAILIRNCYDTLRRAELRRNVWTFSVRRTVLRPYQGPSNVVNASTIGAGVTQQITFGTFAIGTTYKQSDIITGSDGQIYISRKGTNLGNDPTLATSFPWWTLYFGADVAQEFVAVWQSGITYQTGNNVIGSDGNSYQGVTAANINHNPVGDGGTHWVAGTAKSTDTSIGFYAGELMYAGGNLYLSLVNTNTVDPTTNVDYVSGVTFTNCWMQLTTAATLSPMTFIYPVGSGPISDPSTRNVFKLPIGFMREAPQAPKAGSYSIMGAPSNQSYPDWEKNDDFIVSATAGPIVYRFAADFQDTSRMDPQFVEGFSCRVAMEVCPALTQAEGKLQAVTQEYMKLMGEAREINGIEQGPTESFLDDFVQCRY